MSANPLPALFSKPGWALTVPELLIMVISSSVNEEMTPLVPPSITLAPLSVQVPKLASGRMPPLLVQHGASAIHSALLLAQPAQDCFVVKLLAGWVESVTLSV